MQKRYFHLQWRIAYQAQKLRFRIFFGGHQVEDCNMKRPYILGGGPLFRHHKYVFLRKDSGSRERIGNFDGHMQDLLTLELNFFKKAIPDKGMAFRHGWIVSFPSKVVNNLSIQKE
jgi:hypothetical protein